MEIVEVMNLNKAEVANCIFYFEKKTASMTLTVRNSTKYVAIGTAYIDPKEYLPSRGRLLIFEIDSQRRRIV